MNRRRLAVSLISCVLLLVLVIVGVRFPNPVEEGVDGSDEVLPYSPVMRKPPGVDANVNELRIVGDLTKYSFQLG